MDHCADIFNALIGAWQLNRIVTPGGVFVGRAEFSKKAEGVLSYSETGQFTLDDGTVLSPQKAYEWRLKESGIAVYFDDGATKGRLFHRLNFDQSGGAQAEHWCDPDTYQSLYQFDLPQGFSIIHRVQGPKKAYVSKSQFTAL